MKFTVTDRSSIEKGLLVKEPYIVISIRDPRCAPARFHRPAHCRGILHLAFHDAEPTAAMRLPEQVKPMTVEQAKQILLFFQQHRSQIGRVVVNCHQGMSRSPAVVAALAKIAGEDNAPIFQQYQPNLHVYQLLVRASGQYNPPLQSIQEKPMPLTPATKALHSAADHLRKVILEEPALRATLCELLREQVRNQRPRLKVDESGWIYVEEVPEALKEMLKGLTEGELGGLAQNVEKAGNLIVALVTAQKQDTKKDDTWKHVAKLLNVGDERSWPKSGEATDRLELAQLAPLLKDRFVRYWVKNVLKQHTHLDLPTGPTAEQVQTWLRNIVKGIDWEEEAKQLERSFKEIVLALQTTCTNELSLKKTGQKAWMATALFLCVWYRPGTSDSELSPQHSNHLDNFFTRWLPELIKSPIRRPTTRTKDKDMNWDALADPDFRVNKQEGTRKPGSHRDNRGHN